MNAPEISVVMGVYNNAGTLPAALKSILSQEGVELEFIAVDDGSTDGSAAILDVVRQPIAVGVLKLGQPCPAGEP